MDADQLEVARRRWSARRGTDSSDRTRVSGHSATRCPTRRPGSQPSPSASTVAETSWPCTRGNARRLPPRSGRRRRSGSPSRRGRPRRVARSSSPTPGSPGSGTSRTRMSPTPSVTAASTALTRPAGTRSAAARDARGARWAGPRSAACRARSRARGSASAERDGGELLDQQHADARTRRSADRRHQPLTTTGARPSDSSSMRMNRGCDTSACARTTICCSPPESMRAGGVQPLAELREELERARSPPARALRRAAARTSRPGGCRRRSGRAADAGPPGRSPRPPARMRSGRRPGEVARRRGAPCRSRAAGRRRPPARAWTCRRRWVPAAR